MTLASLVLPGAAHAERLDYATTKEWFALSEARIGAGATDPTTGRELSANVSGEALLQPVGNADWPEILRFRPHIGLNGNLEGRTSFLYAGGTFDLLNFDAFYLDGTLGGAIHDGRLQPGDPDRKALGSRFEFRESLELGYQFTPIYSLSAYVDHLSNAGWLARENQGLETAGVHFNMMMP